MKTRTFLTAAATCAALLSAAPFAAYAEGPGMFIDTPDKPEAGHKPEGPQVQQDKAPEGGAQTGEAPAPAPEVDGPSLRERYRSARQGYQGDPGLLGLSFPQNPVEAGDVLKKLFGGLSKMEDPVLAQKVMTTIERIWRMPGGDTVNLLIDRASDAADKNNPDLALKLLDAAVDLAPDYAEAWNRRAFVHYLKGDTERALGDLRRTLALEPNHFKALQGLAKILDEQGQKKGALKAMEQLYKVNPTTPGAKTTIENLKKEVEGQGI